MDRPRDEAGAMFLASTSMQPGEREKPWPHSDFRADGHAVRDFDPLDQPIDLTIEYVDSGGAITVRPITLMALTAKGEHVYLEAFCRRRWEMRSFRFDRVRAVISPDGEVLDPDAIFHAIIMSDPDEPAPVLPDKAAVDPIADPGPPSAPPDRRGRRFLRAGNVLFWICLIPAGGTAALLVRDGQYGAGAVSLLVLGWPIWAGRAIFRKIATVWKKRRGVS